MDEVAQLGAQLPILVRGLYYDQWHRPSGKPERLRHMEEFLAAVATELDDILPIDPENATRASTRELADAIIAFLAARNGNPQHYVWKAKGEDILRKINAARQALAALQPKRQRYDLNPIP